MTLIDVVSVYKSKNPGREKDKGLRAFLHHLCAYSMRFMRSINALSIAQGYRGQYTEWMMEEYICDEVRKTEEVRRMNVRNAQF